MRLRKQCTCLEWRCVHEWFADFRVRGKRYRIKLGTAHKNTAQQLATVEQSNLLKTRHGIFQQKDITFAEFTKLYLRDHVDVNMQPATAEREREIVKMFNRYWGPTLLHEISGHRIEQFKRDRLAGRWRAHRQVSRAKPIKPSTVNRELDTLRLIFNKALAWNKLAEIPPIIKLKVPPAPVRLLTEAQETALIGACPRKLRLLVMLLLLTGARVGEMLKLKWEHVSADGVLTFIYTKTGKIRCVGGTPEIQAVLAALPRIHPYVFTNARTGLPYTREGMSATLRRAKERAGIVIPGRAFHLLRHALATRLVAGNVDIKTVAAILGHSTPRMLLERYAHESEARKQAALAAHPGTVGHILGTAGWAEQKVWSRTNEKIQERLACQP